MWSNSKCYNDDRNQCTRQHKAGDRGDELPWRTISSVFTGTYAHIARVCVCVCVNGSILRLPISFYFQCKSAQSAGLSADPPAQVVFSLDTHTLPQEAKPDCWILAIFHVNGVGRCLFFFFPSVLLNFFWPFHSWYQSHLLCLYSGSAAFEGESAVVKWDCVAFGEFPCRVTRCSRTDLQKWRSMPCNVAIFCLSFFFFGHAKNLGIWEAT